MYVIIVEMLSLNKNLKITLLAFLFISAVTFLVFNPIFDLALFGDDWLALYRYKDILGEWSTGQFNHLTYFLTPYGSQDIIFGLLHKIFGFNSRPYYAVSLILRLLASWSAYFLIFQFSKNKIAGFVSALFFAITPIGAETTNWVFNMPSYFGLFLFSFFLYFFIKSQLKGSLFLIALAGLFYYLTFVFAPIRMHGLPLIIIALDTFLILQKGRRSNFKLIVTRQVFMIAIFFFIRLTGNSMGHTSEIIDRLNSGFNYMSESINRGNFLFILHPFVIIGRFFLPETVWLIINTLVSNPIYRHVVAFSLITFLPFIIILREITREKRQYFNYFIIAIVIWIIVVKVIINSNNPFYFSPSFFGPALLGGFFLALGVIISIATRREPVSNLFFASFVWTFLSFAYPFLWNPNLLLDTVQRYLIIPAFGVALIWGALTSYSIRKGVEFLAIVTAFFFITIQAVITNRYFSNLIPLRGVEVSNRVWSSLPKNDRIGKEVPLVYFFEGNYEIIYYVIAFGFPPHIALDYNIKGNRTPIPMTDWDNLVKAVTTGESLIPHGFEKKPVPVGNVYAFRLNSNFILEDITQEKRNMLYKIINK